MFEALLNFEEESFFFLLFFQYPVPKKLDDEAIVGKLLSLTKCKALDV